MKSKLKEGKLRLEKEDPHWNDIKAKEQFFHVFWEKCKKYAARNASEISSLEEALQFFTHEVWSFESTYHKFIDFLRDIPFATALGYWIQGVATDELRRQKYIPSMTHILEKEIISFFDDSGEVLTLGHLRLMGHQEIIENIRCVSGWSPLEKEEKVECYVHFSHSLSQQTFHFIPHGFDPDRHRVYHRAIKYEAFLDFMQHLPNRDSLIAKLVYFGAPNIEEVLKLKQSTIDPSRCEIRFNGKIVRYPRHLIQDLLFHIKERQQVNDLIFMNVRNACVERSHLNQSFARACKKMKNVQKITPGSLLKLKDQQEFDLMGSPTG